MSVNLMSSVGSANFTFSVKPTSLNPDPRKKVWIWILQNDPDPRKKVWIWILQNDTDLWIWILHTASALVITGTEQFTFEITLKTLNRHKNLKLK